MTKLFLLFTICFTLIIACKAPRKNTTVAAVPSPAADKPAEAASSHAKKTTSHHNMLLFPDVSAGLYAPGDNELFAIQKQYPATTLEQLNLGHVIYTQGACVNCHTPKNIYMRDASSWPAIVEDMGRQANISASEKDAVLKYVLAIKAKQPK